MSEAISGGRLFAIPYVWNRGSPEKNTTLMDYMCKNRMWFSASLTEEEARVNTAWMMTDPSYFKYEVWNGGRLAGVLILHKVTPPVDAIFHFGFLGVQASGVSLFAAKRLLWNFLGWAFDNFGLQRVTMEIPEHYPTLIRFVRQKLAFKYEGELDLERYAKFGLKGDEPSIRAALALYGSRRESAHWNPKTEKWEDVVLLRLLRSEYEARRSSGPGPQTTRDNSQTENRECHLDPSPPSTPSPSPAT